MRNDHQTSDSDVNATEKYEEIKAIDFAFIHKLIRNRGGYCAKIFSVRLRLYVYINDDTSLAERSIYC